MAARMSVVGGWLPRGYIFLLGEGETVLFGPERVGLRLPDTGFEHSTFPRQRMTKRESSRRSKAARSS